MRQVAPRDAIGAALAQAKKNRIVEVWPENWPVFLLFDRMHTQWREGAIGLDYNVLFRFLDRMTLTPDEYDQMLSDIAVMEQAALTEIHTETP